MVTTLHSVGRRFRLVGPLTLSNLIINPTFASGFTGWNIVGSPVVTPISSGAKYALGLHFPTPGSSTGVLNHGIGQSIASPVSQEVPYYLKQKFMIPSALPVPIMADVDFLDFAGSLISTQTAILINAGVVAADWTSTSLAVTIPNEALNVAVRIYIQADLFATSIPDFFIEQVSFSDIDQDYVDGDTAGYVWSGDRYNSTTLESTVPGVLYSFNPTAIPAVD